MTDIILAAHLYLERPISSNEGKAADENILALCVLELVCCFKTKILGRLRRRLKAAPGVKDANLKYSKSLTLRALNH